MNEGRNEWAVTGLGMSLRGVMNGFLRGVDVGV